MNNISNIAVKELVLIGGGHSHVGLLKMFAMKPLSGLRITVLASDVHTPYSGMLPGFVVGEYSYDDIYLDLRPLAECAQARLYHTRVTHIDSKQQLIYSDQRPPIKYDVLSINIGSTPDDYNLPGVAELTIPIKPVNNFILQLETIIHHILTNEHFSRVAVVGGGASGVELILAIQYRLSLELKNHGKSNKKLQYLLISAEKTLLPSHNKRVRNTVHKLFKERNIAFLLNSSITEVTTVHSVNKIKRKNIICNNGRQLQVDAIIWCTKASSVQWPKESGLAVDKLGFIKVNDYLQSVSHNNIFAVGDIASMVNYPRPKSGVYAVKQGKPLFNNLKRFVCDKPLKAYKPQKHFLSLLNCANKTALASRGIFSFYSPWMWRYKNWIDVNFMKQFSELPAMTLPNNIIIDKQMVDAKALKRIQEIPMRCGGCGAKVGSTVLKRVIERLTHIYSVNDTVKDVILGLDQADDAAVIDIPTGQLLVQSLDYFKAFINDPYLLGKIATHHALGDLFAMGATPHSALALVTLPYSLEDILEEELLLIMSGAMDVLEENDMALVGGHTGEGHEMSFGLSVNGFVTQDSIMTKSALLPNDVLILTKPLGSGVILAANMRYQAKGWWVDECLNNMLQSNRKAADIFQNQGVRACTDITGFGLLGHLFEMLQASQVDVHIKLSALPVLSGVHELIKQGIFSSLQEENLRLTHIIENNETALKAKNYPLLFDPQTAGGLLAGVPANKAEQCLKELQSGGYPDAVIIATVSKYHNNEDFFVKFV